MTNSEDINFGDINFEGLKNILDNAVGNKPLPTHGPFWRIANVGDFKNKTIKVKVDGQEQEFKIINNPGQGDLCNLVRALRGEFPFGKDQGVPGAKIVRMPKGCDPNASQAPRRCVPKDSIDAISKWITEKT